MNLTFLRHGEAEQQASKDEERKLTSFGFEQIHKVAKQLKHSFETYDIIFASPLKRAVQTAQIVAETFKQSFTIEKRLECGATHHDIESIIKENNKISNFLFVGHAPDLGIIASELLGLNSELEIKKGGIIKISTQFIRPGNGKLIFFVNPDFL